MSGDVVHRRRGWVTGSGLALPLLFVLGCVGQVGDGADETDPPGTPSGQDPGRVTLHRLNRVEYNNTVRDLLGTTLAPADDVPADDHAFGFDNMADTLTLSPVQFELYERAAEALADDVLTISAASALERYEAETVGGTVGSVSGDAWNLFSNGDIAITQQLPSEGQYIVRARVWQTAAGPDAAQASLTVNGQTFGPFDVAATSSAPMILEQEFTGTVGTATVMVSFLNDFYDDATGDDRNLLVDWVEIEGPIGATSGNPLRANVVTCEPATGGDSCVREIIETFGRKAYRRTLTDDEVGGLFGIYNLAIEAGDDDTEGLKLVLRAMLSSPQFLYRVEIDSDPTSTSAHELNDFELASRLSYFLWSSTPDDTLLDLAEAGGLADDDALRAQVDRMLDDPKSRAMVDNFAGQWLFTRALADAAPSSAAFPDFDDDLRASMRAEADAFFAELLKSDDLALDQLILADFAFVDGKLAQHYGIDAPEGGSLTKVTLDTNQRGGLLRQGAWLTLTSNPDRTSPVKRGKWILENLLCDAPPPPPPGVEGFEPADLEAKTQKELLAAHRADPKCAGCHNVMDPLGLALENFDGVGAFRTEDKGVAVDASGEVNGEAFQTQEEFIEMLGQDPRFTSCAVEKVFTYSLGRAPAAPDAFYLTAIDGELRDGKMTLRELIHLMVLSEPFRYRRGEGGN
ncbi:MAG: DUF1592 domain-containing protein [Myxococcales bacterium]|nr:DUF1592 domain-containing protein [Myxococcales bacterium]